MVRTMMDTWAASLRTGSRSHVLLNHPPEGGGSTGGLGIAHGAGGGACGGACDDGGRAGSAGGALAFVSTCMRMGLYIEHTQTMTQT